MNKSCIRCEKSETDKWFSGPICGKCYRKAYNIRNNRKQKRYRKRYYKANLEKERLNSKIRARLGRKDPVKRTRRNTIRNKFSRTLKGKWAYGKAKAKLRGITFNISFLSYKELVLSGCHYCKKDLTTEVGISLDRINNNKGYSKLNVIPCCGNHNKLRGDYLTVKETEVAVGAILSLKNKGKIAINGWTITVK
jgi:glucan-binding YG repeat protein